MEHPFPTVTTPYCSGLSLLQGVSDSALDQAFSNHPLLFGTVSPTRRPRGSSGAS